MMRIEAKTENHRPRRNWYQMGWTVEGLEAAMFSGEQLGGCVLEDVVSVGESV